MPKGEGTKKYYILCREVAGGWPTVIEGPYTRIDHAIRAMSFHQEHRPRIEYTVAEIIFPSDLK